MRCMKCCMFEAKISLLEVGRLQILDFQGILVGKGYEFLKFFKIKSTESTNVFSVLQCFLGNIIFAAGKI
jgi:hypothetical protein